MKISPSQRTRSLFKRATGYFGYLAIRFLIGCLNLVPFPVALRLGRPLGKFLFRFLKKHRETALQNLRAVFKDKPEAEIRTLAEASFTYLAEFALEWVSMAKIAKNPARYMEIENVELMHSAIHAGGRGAVLLVSHASNWEIMALIAGLKIGRPIRTPIHALARPVKNPYLYEYILKLRGLTGLRSIRKTGAVRGAFDALRRNEIVCLLIDQRVHEGSVEVNFFGRQALTTTLPALAALRFKAPIFYASLERGKDLRFTFKIKGPLPIAESGKVSRDIRENTQRFNDYLESEIRKNPSHWLWMHNRWRIRHGAK